MYKKDDGRIEIPGKLHTSRGKGKLAHQALLALGNLESLTCLKADAPSLRLEMMRLNKHYGATGSTVRYISKTIDGGEAIRVWRIDI